MLFMVVERFRDNDMVPVYQRLRDSGRMLPDGLDYGRIGGLSNEMREKLGTVRPATLGAASRIPGVTPAALTALLRHVRRGEKAA